MMILMGTTFGFLVGLSFVIKKDNYTIDELQFYPFLFGVIGYLIGMLYCSVFWIFLDIIRYLQSEVCFH